MTLPKIVGSLDAAALGQLGGDWIDDTAAHVGDWCVITALTAATFTLCTTGTFTVNGGNAAEPLNGKVLPAGMSIYGRFTAITLTGGSVVAYRASNTNAT